MNVDGFFEFGDSVVGLALTVQSNAYALPGYAGAHVTLATPLDGRVFFAGEACLRHDFTTDETTHNNRTCGAALRHFGLAACPDLRQRYVNRSTFLS